SMHAAPVNVAEGLRRYLFTQLPSVVLTSATLCTSSTGGPPVSAAGGGEKTHGRAARATFTYISSRLGVDQFETLQVGSPFNYEQQATLYIETDLPEPNDANRFLPVACQKILKYLKLTDGGAFVLFTSYRMLIDAANRLKSQLDELGYPLLVQGQ